MYFKPSWCSRSLSRLVEKYVCVCVCDGKGFYVGDGKGLYVGAEMDPLFLTVTTLVFRFLTTLCSLRTNHLNNVELNKWNLVEKRCCSFPIYVVVFPYIPLQRKGGVEIS